MRKKILILGLLVSFGLAGFLLATHHHEEIQSTVSTWDPVEGFAISATYWHTLGNEEDTELLTYLLFTISGKEPDEILLDIDPETAGLGNPGDTITICYRDLRMPFPT